ncbi:hypothetical protein [Mangrovimonas sp. YM274]|uniref:hypothetical protein n=1 Tax=Mangrovimonas sp. YM274 TaxID=3070660 RepID=UPI0027DC2D6B|nr:hypothetical protein [Mangrovimonas sp. YM274]WMI69158.1 hypothetical protein RBH95_02015 [Mangrovimonas sp. YM274]
MHTRNLKVALGLISFVLGVGFSLQIRTNVAEVMPSSFFLNVLTLVFTTIGTLLMYRQLMRLLYVRATEHN